MQSKDFTEMYAKTLVRTKSSGSKPIAETEGVC